jgi:pimeloyl-ACP methyl ester carboxylesterase
MAWQVSTRLGDVPVRGRLSAEPDRPVLLVIRGLFSGRTYLSWLAEALPEADLAIVDLPGDRAPALRVAGVEAAAEAFAMVAERLVPGRRIVPFGVSAGALPALAFCGLRPDVERLVLLDPFLQPAQVWALRALLRGMGVPDDPARKVWVDGLLGVYTGADFRPLLSHLPARTEVLVGDEPLDPIRDDTARFPSLSGETERDLWRAQSGVTLHVCANAGHNIPEEAPETMLAVLRAALRPT